MILPPLRPFARRCYPATGTVQCLVWYKPSRTTSPMSVVALVGHFLFLPAHNALKAREGTQAPRSILRVGQGEKTARWGAEGC